MSTLSPILMLTKGKTLARDTLRQYLVSHAEAPGTAEPARHSCQSRLEPLNSDLRYLSLSGAETFIRLMLFISFQHCFIGMYSNQQPAAVQIVVAARNYTLVLQTAVKLIEDQGKSKVKVECGRKGPRAEDGRATQPQVCRLIDWPAPHQN